MKIEKPHSFTQTEAAARLCALVSYWQRKEPLQVQWRSDTEASIAGHVKGVKFAGTMRVGDSHVVGDFEVGLLGRTVGKQYVEHKLDEYLDPKATLAELQSRAG